MRQDVQIEALRAAVYEISAGAPEADGTLAWSKTTLVLAEARGGGQRGLGYTYAAGACKPLIEGPLAWAVADRDVQVSGHCAPNLHAHVAAAVPNLRHLEYFHDQVRIEGMLFDGALDPRGGVLRPDLSRSGLGLEIKHADAGNFRVS